MLEKPLLVTIENYAFYISHFQEKGNLLNLDP